MMQHSPAKQSNNDLELTSYKEQIKDLNRKLQASEKFKTHFLSNVRNAMVNPFSSVIGLSDEIIKSDLHDWKRVIKLAALIHAEAFDLDFQLKNIFYSAELESGEKYPEICKTDIKDIADSCHYGFKNALRKKKIEFVKNENYEKKYFRTDPSVVFCVLSNLLHNAIKFSKESGKITVDIHSGKSLIIKVIDEGVGMSKEEIQGIFDRFNRVDEDINSYNNGHGLGLSVISNLIEMLGGEIKLDSKKGQGTSFTVVLPESEEIQMDQGELNQSISLSEAYLF